MTNYIVYITPAANSDLRKAVDYYNTKLEGLGKRMAIEIDMILRKLANNPRIYSIRYNNVRAANTPTFPFLIFYKINEKAMFIQILRIFNTSMKPFWKH